MQKAEASAAENATHTEEKRSEDPVWGITVPEYGSVEWDRLAGDQYRTHEQIRRRALLDEAANAYERSR